MFVYVVLNDGNSLYVHAILNDGACSIEGWKITMCPCMQH